MPCFSSNRLPILPFSRKCLLPAAVATLLSQHMEDTEFGLALKFYLPSYTESKSYSCLCALTGS